MNDTTSTPETGDPRATLSVVGQLHAWFEADLDGIVESASEACLAMLDTTRDEIVGQAVSAVLRSAASREAWRCAAAGARQQIIVHRADDRVLEVALVPVLGATGDPIRVIASMVAVGGTLVRLRQLEASADQVIDACRSFGEDREELTRVARSVSEATQEMASIMAELDAAIQENTVTSETNRKQASQAHESAKRGHEVVRLAMESMNGVDQSSSEITEIIGLIDELAFQTNLLALNAAIEAARAGEHGRGFSVVASEIRQLAKQSADGAKAIRAQVRRSRQRVAEGVGHVGASSETFLTLLGSVEAVDTGLAEVARTSVRQSIVMMQLDLAIAKLGSALEDNARFTADRVAAIETVVTAAERLEVSRQGLPDPVHGRNEPRE